MKEEIIKKLKLYIECLNETKVIDYRIEYLERLYSCFSEDDYLKLIDIDTNTYFSGVACAVIPNDEMINNKDFFKKLFKHIFIAKDENGNFLEYDGIIDKICEDYKEEYYNNLDVDEKGQFDEEKINNMVRSLLNSSSYKKVFIYTSKYVSFAAEMQKKEKMYYQSTNKSIATSIPKQLLNSFLKNRMCAYDVDLVFSLVNQKLINIYANQKKLIEDFAERVSMVERLIKNIEQDNFSELTKEYRQILPKSMIANLYIYLIYKQKQNAYFLDEEIVNIDVDNLEIGILFMNYGLDFFTFSDKDKEYLLKVDLNKIKETLEQITSIGLPVNKLSGETFNTIMKYSDLDMCNNIARQLGNGVLSMEFVNENPGIFVNKDNDEYPTLYQNITSNCDLVRRLNINFNDVNYDRNILLLDSTELSHKRELMNYYGINISKSKRKGKKIVDTATLCHLLRDENAFDLLDLAIETQSDLDIAYKLVIKADEFDKFRNRMVLAKQLGLTLNDKSLIGSSLVLKLNQFGLSQEECVETIGDITDCMGNQEMFEILRNKPRLAIAKQFETTEIDELIPDDDFSYNFDGVVISKPKVYRNLTTLEENGFTGQEALFNAIIFGSKLKLNEVEKIHIAIYGQNKFLIYK